MINTDINTFIDGCGELAVELQAELTRRPAVSPGSGGTGELDKCRYLESALRGLGITALARHDAPDARAEGGIRPNLIASLQGADASLPPLWIVSHLDVVPSGELSHWDSDPWALRTEGRRLIGRGTEDNQQGIVSAVLAALAFVRTGRLPRRPLRLLFASDEECGSEFGIAWLLRERPGLFADGGFALVPDGGDSAGATIEIAEKNQLWLRLRTVGKQTHASRPDLGVNAALAGAALAVRLHAGLAAAFAERDSLFAPDRTTAEPTKREANVPNVNTIPGEDVFYMDIRALPRYPVADILAAAARIKEGVERDYGVSVICEAVQCMESRQTDAASPVVALLSAAVRELAGVEARPVGIGGGTVAAHLRNAGMDAAVWSRLDDTAHQPNEYCLLDNILFGAKVMAHMVMAPPMPPLSTEHIIED
jgi:succinyl-diaminopimelate desuccinylase